SGDITLRSVLQSTYDLNGLDDNTTNAAFLGAQLDTSENAHSFMSTVGINIDADLTDNVSAAIRIMNERDWTSVDGFNDTDNIDIDLAYITLKEMLYSPLTVVVGRQDLWYGDGFIVGECRRPSSAQNPFIAPEFTDHRSFDAVRAILDYDPWTLDLLYSRISGDQAAFVGGVETIAEYPDNIDLWGINVGYIFDQYNAEAEAYYFGQTLPRNTLNPRIVGVAADPNGGVGGSSSRDNVVHIIGLRGSFEPVENLDIRGEFAGEFGRVNVGAVAPNEAVVNVEAFACDINGYYTWADFSWMPSLGLGYVFMSGESTPRDGDWNGWINLYRGKHYSSIHEWQGIYYFPDDLATNGYQRQAGTNQHIIMVDGSIQPTDDILLEARYLHFQAAANFGVLNTGSDRSRNIGDEVDLRFTYDYTEDVTFGLLNAWFFPGEYFTSGGSVMVNPVVPVEAKSDDVASELVASVSLSF
ncbi:MAG: alginate export family protein, partial [Candidatus Omnitrophota bacterium]|nr:alginate export family protein [Candidatus Omnitrophota bacterium]